MTNKSLKYTCLFGGGAIRGACYAGAVRAMEEIGINPINIAGSSVGSLIAGLYAIGYNAEELKEVFLQVNFELFKDIQLGLGPKFALSKGEVFLDWVRELIEQKFYGNKYKKGTHKAVTFKDIEKNLVIITTNLTDFGCKEFSKCETPDFEIATAIRISCSMPGLMKPIEYNNQMLVDGDLQKSYPMWKLSPNLFNDSERILEFRLEGDFDGNDKSALDYVNAIYSCFTMMATSFIKEIYGSRDKFDYVVINTGEILIVDFNMSKSKRENLMQMGYDQTMEYFTKYLPAKKQEIIDVYKTIYENLIRTKKLLQKLNYSKAKTNLCELFIDLCELNKIIDLCDYQKIKEFKDFFFNNLHYPALFGKMKLRHEEKVMTELNNLLIRILTKVTELEDYISKFHE